MTDNGIGTIKHLKYIYIYTHRHPPGIKVTLCKCSEHSALWALHSWVELQEPSRPMSCGYFWRAYVKATHYKFWGKNYHFKNI